MIEIPLSKNGKRKGMFVALIDDEDAVLAELNWSIHAQSDGYTLYAWRANPTGSENRMQHLHKAVAERAFGEIPEGYEVDHIDRNGLNNQRHNLRFVTHQQNQWNRGKSANNTSGFKGVSWHKNRQKWQASIRINGKQVYLGIFPTREEAYKAYCDAADEVHKEYANHG